MKHKSILLAVSILGGIVWRGQAQLKIAVLGGNATVSWSTPEAGAVLQATESLDSNNWVDLVISPSPNNNFTEPLVATSRYYRLQIGSSYSTNVVGYANVPVIPGTPTITSNPLNHGDNSIALVIPSPPNGTVVLLSNVVDQYFGQWDDPNMVLALGQPFEITNVFGTEFTLFFIGELPLPPPNNGSSNQPPPWQWARRIASTENPDNELAIGLAIDSAANVYVTGWFDGTNDFGNGVWLTNSPGGGQDIFVAKYNSSGAIQWARRAGGSSSERDGGRGVGVDSAGNVYVTGEFYGDADFGPFNLNAGTEKEFFLAKYDSAGTVQWARQSTGGNGTTNSGWDDGVYGLSLATDDAGNCYVVGFAANVTAFGTPIQFGTTTLSNANTDGASVFLVKYDKDGAVQWAISLNSPEESYANSVSLDGSGNVYVSGSFQASVTIGATNFTNAGQENGFIAKFNSSGVFQWARRMDGTSDNDAMAVSADSSGNVYVGGGFGSAPGDTIAFTPSLILTNIGVGISGAGIGDAFLAKYDASSGAVQWARRFGGTDIDAYTGVTTDSQGNIYAAGTSGGTDFPTDFSGFNAIVAKYDSDGILQWTQSSTGTSGALVFTSPQVDAAGNCYVAGWYQGTATFGATTLQPRSYWNYFLAKLGVAPPTLSIVWSNSLPWLSISGDISNRFVLEYASTLSASNSWQSFATNTIATNPFLLSDTNIAGSSDRFYRARLLQ